MGKPTRKYDLANSHYNPNQPRDRDGKWTDAVGRARLKGGGPVAFMQPAKVTPKTTPFTALDAKPSGKAAMHAPIARHVFPKEQWAKNRLRAVDATIAADAHLEPWFDPSDQSPKGKIDATKLEPGAHLGEAQSWFNSKVTDEDRESLSSDLGLDPRLMKKSIRELRRGIKNSKTPSEDRAAMKTELAKRAAIAKAASHEAKGWVSNLADKLEGKDADTDIAPIVGETLAQHPKLGPLAHIWDRFRLGGYNFKKKIKSGEFTDELPRILARNVGSVLIMFLALHFGLEIPGLGGGG